MKRQTLITPELLRTIPLSRLDEGGDKESRELPAEIPPLMAELSRAD